MNKFKLWLIHKLGGELPLRQELKITKYELQPQRLAAELYVNRIDLEIDEELDTWLKNKLAQQLAAAMVENNLINYSITEYEASERTQYRATILVCQEKQR